MKYWHKALLVLVIIAAVAGTVVAVKGAAPLHTTSAHAAQTNGASDSHAGKTTNDASKSGTGTPATADTSNVTDESSTDAVVAVAGSVTASAPAAQVASKTTTTPVATTAVVTQPQTPITQAAAPTTDTATAPVAPTTPRAPQTDPTIDPTAVPTPANPTDGGGSTPPASDPGDSSDPTDTPTDPSDDTPADPSDPDQAPDVQEFDGTATVAINGDSPSYYLTDNQGQLALWQPPEAYSLSNDAPTEKPNAPFYVVVDAGFISDDGQVYGVAFHIHAQATAQPGNDQTWVYLVDPETGEVTAMYTIPVTITANQN